MNFTSGGKFLVLLMLLAGLFLLVSGQQQQQQSSGNQQDQQSMMATVAIMPLYFFPNGSDRLAEVSALMGNASRQRSVTAVSNTSLSDLQRSKNLTREEQRSSDRRIHTALILNRILFQLGMTSPPSVVPSVTPSSLQGEAGKQMMEAVARAPPPTKSAYFGNGGLGGDQLASLDQIPPYGGSPNPGQQPGDQAALFRTTGNPLYGYQQQQQQQQNQQPNPLVKEFPTSEIYAQRLQSFYPSCGIPNFTLPSVWKSPNQREMRLYFDLAIPRLTNLARRSHTTIMWAKLRLAVTAGPGCRQQPSATDTTSYRELLRCDQRVTISLFQYMRPLSDHRGERRRMLDSKVVPASYRGAIEFNMQSVIAYWQKHQDSNYGLVVLVEDAQGMALPPAMYLQQMNCSDHEIPLPNLADLYGDSVLNKTLVNGQVRARGYPTLDVMSMEAAREEEGTGPYVMATTLRTGGGNALHQQPQHHRRPLIPQAVSPPTLSQASFIQQLIANGLVPPPTTVSSYRNSK